MFDGAESVFINNKEVESIDIVGGGNLYTKPNQHYVLHIEYLSENIDMSNGCYITIKGENNTTLSSFTLTTALTEIVFDGTTILPRTSTPLPELFKSDVTSITASFNPNYGIATVNSVNSIIIDSVYQMNVVYDTGVSGINGYIKIYDKDNSSTLLGQQYFSNSGTILINGVKSSDVVNSNQINVTINTPPGISTIPYKVTINGTIVTISIDTENYTAYPVNIVFDEDVTSCQGRIQYVYGTDGTVLAENILFTSAGTINIYIPKNTEVGSITASANRKSVTVSGNTITVSLLKVEISGVIRFDDNDNVHNVRPSSVVVELYQDGVKYTEQTVNISSNNNPYTFTAPQLNESTGDEYTYTIYETQVEYYEPYKSDTTISYRLIQRQPEQYQEINGSIVWDDGSNIGNTRPSTVLVKLFQDGTQIEQRIVSTSIMNAFDFGSMPRDDGYGHNYTYVVEGADVTGYTKSQSTTNNSTTITYSNEYAGQSGDNGNSGDPPITPPRPSDDDVDLPSQDDDIDISQFL